MYQLSRRHPLEKLGLAVSIYSSAAGNPGHRTVAGRHYLQKLTLNMKTSEDMSHNLSTLVKRL